MSPEQITGAPIGFAADLYALGATLFEALTGRPPFLGPDIVAQHLGEVPANPTSLRPALAAIHDRVLLRALAKAPAERFGSAAEMAEAVTAWPVDGAATSDGARASADGARGPEAEGRAPTGEAPPAGDAGDTGDAGDRGDRELWRTPDGRVVLHRDRRTERDVLIEERATPLDDDAIAGIRRLAAAGGPHVQRVLHLPEDRLSVSYEAIRGPSQPMGALTAAERAALAGTLAALPPGAARGFVRTPGGPVILLLRAPDDAV